MTVRAYKLVWFVPREALDATREAVFAAGAGHVGDQAHRSWYTAGTGTFLGGEGGREERVSELRVETVVLAERARAVVDALVAAHPSDEVAFELYPLAEP